MKARISNQGWWWPLSVALLAVAFVACKPTAPPAAQPSQPPAVNVDLLDPYLAAGITAARSNALGAPQSAAAWGNLGQALHAAEFNTDARICYQRAAELETNSIRWIHLLGLVQLQHEPDAALSNLTRAVEMAGMQADASRVQLAHAMVERGLHDAALKHIQVLLAADPLHAAARLEQARVQLARNQPDLADASLVPCLNNMFTARPAMLLLSQVRQRQGMSDEAAAISRRVLAMPRNYDWPDPFLRDVQALRVDRQKLQDRVNAFLMQKRLPEAGAALEMMFKAFPEDPESWLLLGRLRFLERKCDEAETAYRRHLAVRTNSLNGLIQLALAQLCQEQWTNAAVTLQQAIALKPDFAQAHYNLGYAWSRAGQSEPAIRGFREALRCNPGDANTHAALAEELLRAGKRGEAVLELNKVLGLNPGNQKARQMLERLQSLPK
jgi:tetratricopeptide (TPR) repeat protein